MSIEESVLWMEARFDHRVKDDPTMTLAVAKDIAREIVPQGFKYVVHESLRGKFYLFVTGFRRG
jgi:hypothetical protein